MSITATLFIQIIVFLILIWFTMRFIWPPITRALDARAKKVAEGLSAACLLYTSPSPRDRG